MYAKDVLVTKQLGGEMRENRLDPKDPRCSLIAESIEAWRPGALRDVASVRPLTWRDGDKPWVALVEMRDGSRVVHRRFHDSAVMVSATAIARILAQEGVPTHDVLWTCNETASAIMEYIDGVSLQEALEASRPDRQAKLMEKGVRFLARMQRTWEESADRFEDLYVNTLGQSLEGGAPDDIPEWHARWSRSLTEGVLPRVFREAGRPVDSPAFREAAMAASDILLLFRDIPDAVGIVDVWPGNMILSPDGRLHAIDFENLALTNRDWSLTMLLTEVHCFADCGLSALPRRRLAVAFHDERKPGASLEAWLAQLDVQMLWLYWIGFGWMLDHRLERAERGERNAWEEARSGRPEDRLRRMVHNHLRIEPLCEDSGVARFQDVMRDVVSDWPEVEPRFESLRGFLRGSGIASQ